MKARGRGCDFTWQVIVTGTFTYQRQILIKGGRSDVRVLSSSLHFTFLSHFSSDAVSASITDPASTESIKTRRHVDA